MRRPRLLNGSRRRAAAVLIILVALAQCSALLFALPVLDEDRGDAPPGPDTGEEGLGTDSTSGFDMVLGQVAALLGITLLALVLKRQSLFSNRTLLRAGVLIAMAVPAVLSVSMTLLLVVSTVFRSVPPVQTLAAGGIAVTAGLTALAGWRPTWHSLSTLGLFGAVGAIVLAGIQWGILPVLVLCVLLLVYDALAVYRSGHMLELAEGAAGLRVPVLVLIPTRGGGRPLNDEGGVGGEAVALGLGDIVVPGLLVVASARAISTGLVPIWGMELPAASILALVGSLAGLIAIYALDDGAHAGLPPMLGLGLLGHFAGALATGTSLPAALGAAGVELQALVSGQTVGLAAAIVVVGAALFWYGSREGASDS